MGQAVIVFKVDDLGYVPRKPNITQVHMERSPTINLSKINSGTIWISVVYRTIKDGVKLYAL